MRPRIWIADLDARLDDAGVERCRSLLDDDESARWRRLRFERDRHRFLLSHAFLRTVLGRELGRDPASIRFTRSADGKPGLERQAHEPAGPAFNLSHSGSLAAVALAATGLNVGVDVEYHEPGRRTDALARRNFATPEQRALARMAEPERQARFYDIWTLKEAYLKARGTGLRLPLSGFWFEFAPLRFAAEPGVDPHPARWRFWLARLPGGYSVALAFDPAVAPEEPLVYRAATPWDGQAEDPGTLAKLW